LAIRPSKRADIYLVMAAPTGPERTEGHRPILPSAKRTMEKPPAESRAEWWYSVHWPAAPLPNLKSSCTEDSDENFACSSTYLARMQQFLPVLLLCARALLLLRAYTILFRHRRSCVFVALTTPRWPGNAGGGAAGTAANYSCRLQESILQ